MPDVTRRQVGCVSDFSFFALHKAWLKDVSFIHLNMPSFSLRYHPSLCPSRPDRRSVRVVCHLQAVACRFVARLALVSSFVSSPDSESIVCFPPVLSLLLTSSPALASVHRQLSPSVAWLQLRSNN